MTTSNYSIENVERIFELHAENERADIFLGLTSIYGHAIQAALSSPVVIYGSFSNPATVAAWAATQTATYLSIKAIQIPAKARKDQNNRKISEIWESLGDRFHREYVFFEGAGGANFGDGDFGWDNAADRYFESSEFALDEFEWSDSYRDYSYYNNYGFESMDDYLRSF